ncbi:MAG: DUF4271 domain-containing protein [Bacteroidales bacterium]
MQEGRALFSSPGSLASQATEMQALVPREAMHHAVWFFIYLFVLLGFFAWIRQFYGNILIQTVQSTTNYQVAAKMFKNNSLLQLQLDNILYALYLFSTSLLLFHVERRYGIYPYGLRKLALFSFDVALLTGIFFARMTLVNAVGLVFDRLSLLREYLYHSFVFNKITGIALLPLMVFMLYTRGWFGDFAHWISALVLAGILVLRVVRGVVYSFKKEVSIFMMFLYLCALEIAPLLLLYRWLEGTL